MSSDRSAFHEETRHFGGGRSAGRDYPPPAMAAHRLHCRACELRPVHPVREPCLRERLPRRGSARKIMDSRKDAVGLAGHGRSKADDAWEGALRYRTGLLARGKRAFPGSCRRQMSPRLSDGDRKSVVEGKKWSVRVI